MKLLAKKTVEVALNYVLTFIWTSEWSRNRKKKHFRIYFSLICQQCLSTPRSLVSCYIKCSPFSALPSVVRGGYYLPLPLVTKGKHPSDIKHMPRLPLGASIWREYFRAKFNVTLTLTESR